MKKTYILLLTLLLTVAIGASAQRRKGKGKPKPAPVVVQESPQDIMFKSMLSSTAKVMFIDSMVVDKDSFMQKLPLNSESGTLFSRDGIHGYVNEFGDRAIYSVLDDSIRNIYSSDKIGNEWSKGVRVSIGDGTLHDKDYPFLMSDGITLYFSARGEQSLGGQDIFMTMFDSQSGSFYEPQNYGLPFNSRANDYLIAIDELDTLGWLVTDRFQPEGKVCIYTFEPTATRQSFESDDITTEELTSLANLNSIKDTWKFGNRKRALARVEAMKRRELSRKDPNTIFFVINDATVYRNINDFRSVSARQSFLEWRGRTALLESKEQNLEQLRKAYARGDSADKRQLQQEILRKEVEVQQLREALHQQEKKIRELETTKTK